MAHSVLVLLLTASLLVGSGSKKIPVTRWVSPDGSPALSYASWRARQPESGPFRHGRVYASSRSGVMPVALAGTVEVIVNARLYPEIDSVLLAYVHDLESENWRVNLDTISPGSPEDIRAFLRSIPGLTGAVFVGDLPVPWFQMLDDFDANDTLDGYEEFPCDLFYADRDGVWTDSLHHEKIGGRDTLVAGGDGVYDRHTGTIWPDIWLGRLTASPLGDELQLLRNYFDKDSRFRRNGYSVEPRALVYVDDDWVRWAEEWGNDMDSLFKTRILVAEPETTVAPDYRLRIGEEYEWVSLFAHSWPGGHSFKHQDSLWTWMYSSEIPGINPKALFYNLFACSNCRYVEPGYMGGRYVFAPTFGLAAVGSTKTGSMLDFMNFYNQLGEGKCLGAAFLEWFAREPLFDIGRKSWFYGMTVLGDPTLKPVKPVAVAEGPRGRVLTTNLRCEPSPFRTRTTVSYFLSEPGEAALTIYDPTGRMVAVLRTGSLSSGTHRFVWDGTDRRGRSVPPGVYFCRFEAGTVVREAKVVKIR